MVLVAAAVFANDTDGKRGLWWGETREEIRIVSRNESHVVDIANRVVTSAIKAHHERLVLILAWL